MRHLMQSELGMISGGEGDGESKQGTEELPSGCKSTDLVGAMAGGALTGAMAGAVAGSPTAIGAVVGAVAGAVMGAAAGAVSSAITCAVNVAAGDDNESSPQPAPSGG